MRVCVCLLLILLSLFSDNVQPRDTKLRRSIVSIMRGVRSGTCFKSAMISEKLLSIIADTEEMQPIPFLFFPFSPQPLAYSLPPPSPFPFATSRGCGRVRDERMEAGGKRLAGQGSKLEILGLSPRLSVRLAGCLLYAIFLIFLFFSLPLLCYLSSCFLTFYINFCYFLSFIFFCLILS